MHVCARIMIEDISESLSRSPEVVISKWIGQSLLDCFDVFFFFFLKNTKISVSITTLSFRNFKNNVRFNNILLDRYVESEWQQRRLYSTWNFNINHLYDVQWCRTCNKRNMYILVYAIMQCNNGALYVPTSSYYVKLTTIFVR